MNKYKTISSILLVGIIFYLFIESFYNVIVNINGYIFMNFSEIVNLMPTLIIFIFILVIIFFVFMSAKLKREYKAYLIIYLIIGIRICTQFIKIPSLIFVLNFLMLFILLIFFMGIFLLIEQNQTYITKTQLIGSIIFGFGIQFFFLITNVSSSLTYDYFKISTTFILTGLVMFFNNYLFFPKTVREKLFSKDEKANSSNGKPIPLIHIIILGILFIFSMMWAFNPIALSAYDPINLNINGLNSSIFWFSYGYTFYILIILLALFLSYILITKYIILLDQRKIRSVIILSIGLTCMLTSLALYIVGTDFTIISTIYLSITIVISIFSILLYIYYLIHFFSFESPRRLLYGVIFFILTGFIFLILHVDILWYQYMSLLSHVTIQIISAVVLILSYELSHFKKKEFINLREFKFSKSLIIFFAFNLLLYGISLSFLTQTRRIDSVNNINPTFMIWNIHNAIGDDDIFDLDRIVSDIKENNPDIIGLNEVDLGAIKTASIDLPSYFAHKLNMYYFYGYTFYKHYGNLILSKYPIINARIIHLPLAVQSAEPRSLIRAEIFINSSIWIIFITHLSTESDDRIAQVPFIVNQIQNEPNFEKIIWMGDFNLEPTSPEYALINATSILNFKDTYRYLNTFPGYTGHFDNNHIPQKRIDYIMCSPDLLPKTSYVFCSISSDHCAVITQF